MRMLRDSGAVGAERLTASAARSLSVSPEAAGEALQSLLADGLVSNGICGIQLGSGPR